MSELAVGFGGLLSIMALAGIEALRVLGHFRRSDEQIRSTSRCST